MFSLKAHGQKIKPKIDFYPSARNLLMIMDDTTTKKPSSAFDSPQGSEKFHIFDEALTLDSGAILQPFSIAYQTWGRLNKDQSNAILICHTLTGDQYAAGTNPVTRKSGWWSNLIGRGKSIDPEKYFIICSNVIGGCSGSTGPASKNPVTGQAYGLDFPFITIGDMVRAQAMLLDALNVDTLFSVIGGSMGAMQVLQWSTTYPSRVRTAIPIAGAPRHSAQNIAFHEVGRQAIMADTNWQGGAYNVSKELPRKGLAVARMAAHITYLSEAALTRKFGRNLQEREKLSFGFEADFQIESYLRHQGFTFVERFDANSYLYITRAMDYFDIAGDNDGILANAFTGCETKFCIMSFTSDWLFPTRQSQILVRALNSAGANVSFVEIESDKGHDAFLLDEPEMFDALDGFLSAAAMDFGLKYG